MTPLERRGDDVNDEGTDMVQRQVTILEDDLDGGEAVETVSFSVDGVAYEIDGERVEEMPVNQSDVHHATPIYEYLDGWWEDITGCRTFEDLPENAQKYVLALEAMSGTRISVIGVGPARDAVIVRHDLVD